MMCIYCKESLSMQEQGLIVMDGEYVHKVCAMRSGDLDAEVTPAVLLTDNNGIQCIDCGDRFYYNEELVFDDDESKIVSEQYPDWSYARCQQCQEDHDNSVAPSPSGVKVTPNEREVVLAWKRLKKQRDAFVEVFDREAAHGCHKQMEGMARAFDLLTGKSFDTLIMDPALAIVKEETK